MSYYSVIGIESSPYAIKVRAVLRYRRLPHRWIARMPQFYEPTAAVRPLIMPVVQFPDGEYRTDSTPIIYALEDLHPDERSVIPENPACAFLNALLEDFADEWLTKCLFNYRFSLPRDAVAGAGWVMDDAHPGLNKAQLDEKVGSFIERQTSRMGLVGCTPENTPLLQQSYLEVLQAFERFVATDRFLFGTRPALADFAFYGQLSTLAHDPTPAQIMSLHAPRTQRWIRRLDDASGVEGAWDQRVADLPASLVELLALCGRYYLPLLRANRTALDNGDAELRVELGESTFAQPVYRYHAKCLDFIASRMRALPLAQYQQIESLLEETGCLQHLADFRT